MAVQITASKSKLFLNCQRPFDPVIERDETIPVGEDAHYGSALHSLMEHSSLTAKEALERFDLRALPEDCAELVDHYLATRQCLEKWLAGENQWGKKLTPRSKEIHLGTRLLPVDASLPAWAVGGVETIVVGFDEATHHYELPEAPKTLDRWFGGTPDLVVEDAESELLVVVDYKSGVWQDYSNPLQDAQLQTLALMTSANAVAILHSPRSSFPVMYSAEYPAEQAAEHWRNIHAALARVGDGSMRPGEWCRFCPTKGSCPTQHAELLASTTALVRKVTGADGLSPVRDAVELGRFHLMLGQLDKLANLAKEEIRERVRSGEVIQRPDGKELQLIPFKRESLSKSSVLEALGTIRGEAELEKLRKLGVVKVIEGEELRAK